MDELRRRLDKMMLDAIGGCTTSNVPPPEQRPFTMADLQWAMIQLGKPRGPPPVKIVESIYMTDEIIDWSLARSPSRTKRRMRYNAARLRRYVPKKEAVQLPDGSLVMHPATAAHLRNSDLFR